MTYEELDRKYQRLSHLNMMRARNIGTEEGYWKAQSRERLLRKAFFNDCKKYLNGDLRPK